MTLVRRSLIAVLRTPLAQGVFVTYFLRAPGPAAGEPVPGAVRGVHQWAGPAGVHGGPGGGRRTASRRPSARRSRVPWPTASASAGCCWAPSPSRRRPRSWRRSLRSLLPFGIDYAVLGVGFATAGSMLFATLATHLPADIRSSVLNLALVPAYLSGILGSLLAVQVVERLGWRPAAAVDRWRASSWRSPSSPPGGWRYSSADGLRCRHDTRSRSLARDPVRGVPARPVPRRRC